MIKITHSIIPYITDLARAKVIVSNNMFGSLKTVVTESGVSVVFSGWSTIFNDVMSPDFIL